MVRQVGRVSDQLADRSPCDARALAPDTAEGTKVRIIAASRKYCVATGPPIDHAGMKAGRARRRACSIRLALTQTLPPRAVRSRDSLATTVQQRPRGPRQTGMPNAPIVQHHDRSSITKPRNQPPPAHSRVRGPSLREIAGRAPKGLTLYRPVTTAAIMSFDGDSLSDRIDGRLGRGEVDFASRRPAAAGARSITDARPASASLRGLGVARLRLALSARALDHLGVAADGACEI